LGTVYNHIASINYKKKEYSKAIENYKKAIRILTMNNNELQLSVVYSNTANVYEKIGNNKKFEEYQIKAFQYAESAYNLKGLQDIGEILYQFYKNKKEYNKALTYYEKSNQAKDTIEKSDNKNAILKAEFKFDNEKKLTQIKALIQEKNIATLNNQQQRNFILVLIFLFVSILATSYVLFKRFKIKKQNEYLKNKLQEAEKIIIAEKKAAQSELKAFKSQMNPHFFYNALNTVQSYILSNDKKLAIKYLSKFSILTRSILEMTEKEYISVNEEIKTLELYLDIEKARFNDDFEFNIRTNNINDLDQTKIPAMFLQPYVENAVKHGLLHKEGTKKLDIDFSYQNDTLFITVDDNGIGREKSNELNSIKNRNHKSFATDAMEHRIDILNKTRTKPMKINYIDKKNNKDSATGTAVLIEIPL